MRGVAIPYIIALIIGVIVIAVLGYWFISSGGKGSNIGTEAECTARKTEYCATQSSDAQSKVKSICKDGASWNPMCFCPSIIPGWKDVNNPNNKCPT